MIEYQTANNKKYKIEEVWNNTIYIKKLEINYILGLYYLIFWKDYPKKKNT